MTLFFPRQTPRNHLDSSSSCLQRFVAFSVAGAIQFLGGNG